MALVRTQRKRRATSKHCRRSSIYLMKPLPFSAYQQHPFVQRYTSTETLIITRQMMSGTHKKIPH